MLIGYLWIFSLLILIHGDPMELSEIIIREDIPIGHLLIQLNTSIHTQISYRFVSHNHREIQRYFLLNSSTGELRIGRHLDRQMICTHRHVQCKFVLKIFELFHEKLYHIPIVIEEVNGIRPRFLYNSSKIVFHISENSPIHQSKLFIQQVYHPDQKQLKYQLKNFAENFPFILEINNDLTNRLALVLIQPLDRETIDFYHCTLHISDNDEQLQIEILIDDVNDQSPIFEHEKYAIELSENTPVNTTILQVHASDGDIGLNGRIIYDFTDASKQFNHIFSIDNQTGVIRLRSSFDYEQRSFYIFYIEARDCGKEIRSSQTLINITIVDENDNYPRINFRFLSEIDYNPSKHLVRISENYPIDKFFSQILVTDDDSSHNGHVRLWFECRDSSFHLYQIDSSTYILNRTKSFDFEYQQNYHLKFYAEDSHPFKPLQTNQILTMEILDENDNSPQFVHSFYHLSLPENNPLNVILTKIEAYDLDQGENGRITYEILTNDSSLPFRIDLDTGILRCWKSLDREERSKYQFEILACDHGYPQSLSAEISVRIDIEDINDNQPNFENDKYEFSIEENLPRGISFARIRASDRDFHSKLIYRIENDEKTFEINSQGELSLRHSIDRETKDYYQFDLTVSDQSFKTSVPVTIRILDINDCQPQWKNPEKNQTKLFINKDSVMIGMTLVQLEAIDRDDISNGNGFVSYYLEEKCEFLNVENNGELRLNSTPIIGRYLLQIRAEDHGKSVRYSSIIFIDVLVGTNHTDGSEYLSRLNALSTLKRVIFLTTFFLSMAFILVFIISTILIMICRYRKQKYLYYMKCHQQQQQQQQQQQMMMMIDSSSNSSKLSLENIHQPSAYAATHIFQSLIKPTPTSDYYSNSSKHEEDVDEWTDEPPPSSQRLDSTEWSIEKILYPDWLYRDTIRKNTSTFIDVNSFETESSTRSDEKQTISSNSQPSPKQVRFGCEEQIHFYRHLNTTIQQLKTGTTTTLANPTPHNTFL